MEPSWDGSQSTVLAKLGTFFRSMSARKPSADLTPNLEAPVPTSVFTMPVNVCGREAGANDSISIRSSRASEEPDSKMVDEEEGGHYAKETHIANEAEDFEGNKMINEYMKQRTIGTGSYAKVVLYHNVNNNRLYALKVFHKSWLRKTKVGLEESAMQDVMREVAIMKQLDHPNVVLLEEVIDDPEVDKLYMVLEYVPGGSVIEGTGPLGGIGEELARRYFRDTLSGLMYLHHHNIVHGDIKPKNLLVSEEGKIKIADFGVSHMFSDGNDHVRRSPGTPMYTAPECCKGEEYSGKSADIWALGCTLFVLLTGTYPFTGGSSSSSSVPRIYDTILTQDIQFPDHLSPEAVDILKHLLQKDPKQRLTLEAACCHPWVALEGGLPPVAPPQHFKAILVDDSHMVNAFSSHRNSQPGCGSVAAAVADDDDDDDDDGDDPKKALG